MTSIVIAYHNRREQFLRTLKSIKYFGDPEIIVVDDASEEDQRLDDVAGITLIRIAKEDKKWVNTCIPYNMGIARARGDVIIIQNAECVYTGDILSYCKRLKRGVMFSFAAYSLDRDLPSGDREIPVLGLKPMILKEPQRIQFAHHGWYNHSIYRPCALHFCNALMRRDIEDIGGFDERYAPGLAHEDDEFLERIRRSGVDVQIVDDPFVIHQKHVRTDYSQRTRAAYEANRRLFEEVTKPGQFRIAPLNGYYAKFNIAGTSTHRPLIRLVLNSFSPKFVMELGIGWYSTLLFRDYCNAHPDRQYMGIENERKWIIDIHAECQQLNIVHHDLGDAAAAVTWDDLSQYMKDTILSYYNELPIPENKPRLLFVDNYRSCRAAAFNALKDKFDFVVIHDCELSGAFYNNYDRLDTSEFNSYYLKNNLAWAALLIRSGIDDSGVADAIAPLIEEHLQDYPAVKYMNLSRSYL
jgi:hypothetical protein